MKKTSLVFLFCFTICSAYSQFYSDSFNNIIIKGCPVSNENFSTLTHWDIFQTTNGEIDGERIENCFNFSNQQRLSVGTAVDESPIFLKSNVDLRAELMSDFPYSLNFGFSTTENDFCDCSFDCTLPACFSVKLKLSAITGNDTVKYEKLISDPLIENNRVNFINCIITEAADKTILNDIEITLIKETFNEGEEIRVFSISLFQFEGVDFENRIIPNEFKINSAYFVSPMFFNPYQFGATIVRHLGPGIPNQQNIFYQDLIPEDSDEKQTINMILTPEEELLFQNFTSLRGAIVDGDPNETRHNFNLINEGSTLCFPDIVEAIFSNEDNFIHKSGKIDFQNREGCMQFRDKTKFVMHENSYLEYGKKGKGLLALKHESQLVLEPNARMNFNGELVLKESDRKSLSMILNEGSEFTFDVNSLIWSDITADEIQLNIYLNGGKINTDNLDDESLKFLNIIDYTDQKIKAQYLEFDIFPNPTSSDITITNNAITKVRFDIFSISGKHVLSQDIEGRTDKTIDLNFAESGIYFIKSNLGTQRKLVINR